MYSGFTQAPSILHKFLVLLLKGSRQDLEKGQCTFVPANRKMVPRFTSHNRTYEGQIILYVISLWWSNLTLISIEDIFTNHLMVLLLLEILSQSSHFCFIWHETISFMGIFTVSWLYMYLFLSSLLLKVSELRLLSNLGEYVYMYMLAGILNMRILIF